MTAERQQFSLAVGLAAGVNGVLLLGIVWIMAVSAGLGGRAVPLKVAPLEEEAEIVVNLVAAPDVVPAPAASREAITAPEDGPDVPPPDAPSRFISSRNLRAASEEPAAENGLAGQITQQGLDKPGLDLRDSDFKDGEPATSRPPESAPPPPAPTETPRPPSEQDIPPDPSKNQAKATPAEAASPTPQALPDKIPPSPAKDPPAAPDDPAPAAFRDPAATALIPLKTPVPPKRLQPAAPPLTRIPDRVPQAAYQPGLRKTKTLGTISNKGRASLDANATAEGIFSKTIRAAIEKNWRRRMLSLSGLANPGLVEVEFEVDPKGRISNVKLANPGEANPVMQDCALSAVIEARLPAPPQALFDELQDTLTGGRMRCSFSFLIY